MESLKCPNCGGTIVKADNDIYFCPYCGVGIPADIKKQHLKIEIVSDETKKIIHKNKAKEIERITELLFLIFIIVLAIVLFTWNPNS